jgi:hypothetical protein
MSAALLLTLFSNPLIQGLGGLNWEVDQGTQTGYVLAAERRGLWQTVEGHMLRATPGAYPELGEEWFYFSVGDPDVARQIDDALRSGRRVTLHYKQYALRGWNKGATSYDIVAVEFLES